MYQKERLDAIIEILKSNGYVTVKYLTDELHYSNATINRDLNILKAQNIIERTYGGVELVHGNVAPLPFRYHKMRAEKNRMGKLAADIIKDGETVFIDGSSTTQFIGKYLTDKKDITVISNNMALIMHLSEYGIDSICLGGRVLEPPNMLGGDEATETAKSLYADKVFFSASGVSENGDVVGGYEYYELCRTMIKHSEKAFLLISSDKIGKKAAKLLTSLDKISCVISDFSFPDKLKEHFSGTEFIRA